MYAEKKIKCENQKGFTLVEALISAALISVVSLGLIATVTQTNSGIINVQSQVGAQSLRESLLESSSNSLSCTPRLTAQGTTYGAGDIPISLQLDDGSVAQAGTSLPKYNVKINSLVLRNTASLGNDPCYPNNTNTLYSGAVILAEQKLAGNNAVAGGIGLKTETVGNISVSVDNTTQTVTRCTGGSPTDICDACIALGGTYNPASAPHCVMKVCKQGTVFLGWQGTTPICKALAPPCPNGDTIVSDGAGGFSCETLAAAFASPTPLPSPSPSPGISPVPSPSPSPGGPSPTPSPGASATPPSGPVASPSPSPSLCPPLSPFASQITSGWSTTGVAVVSSACATYMAGDSVGQIPGAYEMGSGTGTSSQSVYISAFDNGGNLQWTTEYAQTNAIAQVGNMVQDNGGCFFIAGSVSCDIGTTCSFGGTVYGNSALGPNGASNAFLMKFNSMGVLLWISQISGVPTPLNVGADAVNVVVDASQNAYVVGYTEASLGGIQNGAHGSTDAFVAKFDTNGNLIFVSQSGLSGDYFYGKGVTLDSSGNIILSGQLSGPNTYPNTNDGCSIDLVKLSPLGKLIWGSGYGDNACDLAAGSGLVADSSGNFYVPISSYLYLGGKLSGNNAIGAPQNTGLAQDIGIVEFDSSGKFVAASQVGGNGAQIDVGSSGGNNIYRDSSGNFYLSGEASGYIGGGCFGSNCSGGSTVVAKLDPNLNFQWANQIGTTEWAWDWGANSGITGSALGNIFLTVGDTAPLGTRFGSLSWFSWQDFSGLTTTIDPGTGFPKISPTAAPAPSPIPTWPVQLGQSGQTVKAMAVIQDSDSNFLNYLQSNYEVGSTTGQIPSGIQEGVAGTQDSYISSFALNGAPNWLYQIGAGAGSVSTARGVFLHPDLEDINVLGDTNGMFSSGPQGNFYFQQNNLGAQNAFLVQINVWGYIKFTSEFGAGPGSHVYGNALVLDQWGNNFVVGQTDASLGGNLNGAPVRGTTDAYMAILNGSGGYQWAFEVSGGAGTNTSAQAIGLDSSGLDYIVGSTTGFVEAQIGIHGTKDALLVCADGYGGFLWSVQLGAAGASTQANGIVYYNNNLYMVGTTTGRLGGTLVGTHGSNDLFIAQFDMSGNKQWITQIGVAAGNTYGQGISIDPAGNIYVTGYTDGIIPGAIQSGSHGTQDAVVARFDTSGNFNWVNQLGTAGAVTQGLDIGYYYASDNNTKTALYPNPTNGVITGFTSGSLGGTQDGTHGLNDMMIFRVNSNGIMP